jgi:quinol monooxygenase YgiN
MIHVIATISLQPGSRAAFLQAFHELMPLVHEEVGCIEYGPAIDVDAGLPNGPALRDDVVVVVEKWESTAALRDHLQAPHMTTYRAQVRELVISTQIQVLEPA